MMKRLWVPLGLTILLISGVALFYIQPTRTAEVAPQATSSAPVVINDMILDASTISQYQPDVVYDSARDNYLMVWNEAGNTGWSSIYGWYVLNNGETRVPELTIADDNTDKYRPKVAYDAINDQYLIVWLDIDNLSLNAHYRLHGRYFDAHTLEPAGDTFDVATSPGWDFRAHNLAYSPVDQTYMVTWDFSEVTGTNYGIGAQPIPATSTPINASDWITVIYEPGPEIRVFPDIAWNALSNEFVIVFERWFDAGGGDGDYDINYQRIDSTGALLGDWSFITAEYSNNERLPSIAACPGIGKFLVTWTNETQPFVTLDVKGILVNMNDYIPESTIYIANDPVYAQSGHDVSCTYSGDRFSVGWWSDSQIGFYPSMRLVDPYGDVSDPLILDEVAVNVSGDVPYGDITLADGYLKTLVVWENRQETLPYRLLHGAFVVPYAVYLPMTLQMP